jgi:hypothetical protein
LIIQPLRLLMVCGRVAARRSSLLARPQGLVVPPTPQALRAHQRYHYQTLNLSEWTYLFGDAKMTTTLLDQLTRYFPKTQHRG